MIGSCGMGESLISIAAAGTGLLSGGLVEKVLADKAARAELDALLASSRDAARAIVTEHGEVVEALRDALMERDELVGREITDVITRLPGADVRTGAQELPRGPHRRRRTDVPSRSVRAEADSESLSSHPSAAEPADPMRVPGLRRSRGAGARCR